MRCYECGKMNHFAKMCSLKKRIVNQMAADEGDEEDEEEDIFVGAVTNERMKIEDLFVGAVTKEDRGLKEWNVEVKINGKKLSVK